MLRRGALLALLASGLAGASQAASLDPDEGVLFLPGTARATADGRVELDVHAWVYDREHSWGLNTAFARYLGLNLRKLSPAEQLRFRQRTALFHSESEDDHAIDLVIEGTGELLALPLSGKDGRVDARVVVGAAATDAANRVHFHTAMALPDRRRFRGQALLVPAEGLSVISDIDDTIKRTDVRNERQMLLNTFARRFEAVPGMAAHYRTLAARPDTRFHYLSASPIQLYPALAEFLQKAAFPAGSMHLRESTTLRTLVPGKQDSMRHKTAVIERLLADFPQRRFLLVGDSGEADPEIYAPILRAHPERITAVVIRDVSDEARSAARYREAFTGIDPTRWHILPRAVTSSPWPSQAQ